MSAALQILTLASAAAIFLRPAYSSWKAVLPNPEPCRKISRISPCAIRATPASVITVYMARRPIRRANVAAQRGMNRRTAPTRAVGDNVVVRRRDVADAMIPCCSRCRRAHAENNCDAKGNAVQHFRPLILPNAAAGGGMFAPAGPRRARACGEPPSVPAHHRF